VQSTLRCNVAHATRFLRHVIDPSACSEIRILKASWKSGFIVPAEQQFSMILGGWYNSVPHAVIDCQTIRNVSAYITVNPVNPAFLARTDNKIAKMDRGGGTKDSDIVALCNIFWDLDSRKPIPDISATDEERQYAIDAQARFLDDHPEIRRCSIWGTSGNGAWGLTVLPRLPNDAQHNDMIARFIAWLGARYTDDHVEVDQKTKNPARIMGIAGLVKCKGSNRLDRPWRLSTLDSPEDHVPEPFDLPGWVAQHAGESIPGFDMPGSAGGSGGSGGFNAGSGGFNGPGSPGGATGAAPGHPPAPEWSISEPRTIARVSAYLASVPPAVSGQDGHNQTYDAACCLIHGFDLSPAAARPFLAAWNIKCVPPWTEAELNHKLDQANAGQDKQGRPRGFLRDVEPPPVVKPAASPKAAASKTPAIDTNHAIARAIVSEKYTHATDGRSIRFWNEQFLFHDGSCYRIIPRAEMASGVSAAVENLYVRDYTERMAHWMGLPENERPKTPPGLKSVGTKTVADVTQAMSSLNGVRLAVADCPDQPAWVHPTVGGQARPDWDPHEVLPTHNKLLHLPTLVGIGKAGGAMASPNTPNGLPSSASSVPTGAIIPATPAFFGTYSLTYSYDATAPAPSQCLKFFDQIWPGDPESVALLQEWMGYLLTSDTSKQKFLMLIGPPRSGKGTIARLVELLIGASNVVSPLLSSLGDGFGRECLVGKPLAIVSDAKIGHHADSQEILAVILAITGEDKQTVKRKYASDISVKLPTRFMVMANDLPRIPDASGALASRLLMLQMTRSFAGIEDYDLLPKLAGELPGLLNWAIAGWARLRETGRFTVPASSQELGRAMDDLSSPIRAFLGECYVVGDDYDSVLVDDIYNDWRSWWMEKGRPADKVGDKDGFGRQLRSAVPRLAKKRVWREVGSARQKIYTYFGLRRMNEDEFNADRPGDGGGSAGSGGHGVGANGHVGHANGDGNGHVPF
jgi:putative DNA primase/helicase